MYTTIICFHLANFIHSIVHNKIDFHIRNKLHELIYCQLVGWQSSRPTSHPMAAQKPKNIFHIFRSGMNQNALRHTQYEVHEHTYTITHQAQNTKIFHLFRRIYIIRTFLANERKLSAFYLFQPTIALLVDEFNFDPFWNVALFASCK